MFVCICNQVSDKQIRQAVYDGHCSMESLSAELAVGTCCGKCKTCAKEVLQQTIQEITRPQNVAPLPLTCHYA